MFMKQRLAKAAKENSGHRLKLLDAFQDTTKGFFIHAAQAFIPIGLPLLVTFFITSLGMILFDRMWEKLPLDHPAVFLEPGFGSKQ